MPDLAAFYYTALFRTLRDFLGRFRSTNPTWIKVPSPELRLSVSASLLLETFAAEVEYLINLVRSSSILAERESLGAKLAVASSRMIPLESCSTDAVISSPPYCTRIDYAVATRIELAILGLGVDSGLKELRDRMIGTPTITGEDAEGIDDYGPLCSSFLKKVGDHPTKASKTYYLRIFRQYFGAMKESIKEIDRVLNVPGHCVLVAQDSHYKDLHCDLPGILEEIAVDTGWTLSERINFRSSRTIAQMNSRITPYRQSPEATESILVMRKG
jgi:hypothetical protein